MSELAASALDLLAPIALEALVEEASLLARVDRKYVLPASEADTLLPILSKSTRVLDIAGHRTFGYRSTYFDTEGHASFLTSGRRHRSSWKVRTRAYLATGDSWLEVKTVGQRGMTVKQRIPHPESDQITATGRKFLAGIVPTLSSVRLRPVLTTGYRRTTLFLPASASRVTIDVDLGWTSVRSSRDLDRPHLAIVETKTGSTPSSVDRLLWSRGHRPLAISKFGVGMAALHPELPRLKWHHVMNRHLGLARTV